MLSNEGSVYGSLLAINAIIAEAPSLFQDLGVTNEVVEKIVTASSSDKVCLKEVARLHGYVYFFTNVTIHLVYFIFPFSF